MSLWWSGAGYLLAGWSRTGVLELTTCLALLGWGWVGVVRVTPPRLTRRGPGPGGGPPTCPGSVGTSSRGATWAVWRLRQDGNTKAARGG